MTHQYEIKGMTCGSCVARVKSELLKLGDVASAEVQLQSPQAVITMSRHIPVNTLQQAVTKAGRYTISEAGHHTGSRAMETAVSEESSDSYYPIFLIFGYITGVTLLIQLVQGQFNWMQWMSHFMAGFFLLFSFFKLLNLKAFAEGYGTYDVVAKAIPAWGFIYPFVELGLGILFLSGLYPLGTNIVTFLVMGISTIGVVQSLLKKTKFQCACLGTIIKLPLSKVTLFEDLLMVVMSAIMIATMI
jgi:cation transport ATPase